ncbi:MAG: hypothetical protein ABFS34_06810 [Gemmatimonadota bacterium]
MKKFWLLALVAVFGVAACDTAEETADAADAAEEVMEEPAEAMAMELPAVGDYTAVAVEGGSVEMGEGDVAMLHLEETTWAFTVNGEPISSGTWSAEEGLVNVAYESGDCAGETAVFDLAMDDEGGFTNNLVESTCEAAVTMVQYAPSMDDMMEEEADGEDNGEM